MNCRIFETPHGQVLLHLDLDENSNHCVRFIGFVDQGIYTVTAGCTSKDHALSTIANFSQERADHLAADAVRFFVESTDPINGQKCVECGCTDNQACYHEEHGPCWWVDPLEYDRAAGPLCSHCAEKFEDVERPWQPEAAPESGIQEA